MPVGDEHVCEAWKGTSLEKGTDPFPVGPPGREHGYKAQGRLCEEFNVRAKLRVTWVATEKGGSVIPEGFRGILQNPAMAEPCRAMSYWEADVLYLGDFPIGHTKTKVTLDPMAKSCAEKYRKLTAVLRRLCQGSGSRRLETFF